MKNFIILLIALILIVPFASAKFREIDSTGLENELPVLNTQQVYNPPASFETINAVKDNNEKLYGVVGKSQVLNFDTEIERVSITNENIAEIVVLTPKQLLVNGKAPGSTSIIFWNNKDSMPVFYNLVM